MLRTREYIKPKPRKRIAYCAYHSCVINPAMVKKHRCLGKKPRCKHMIIILDTRGE